MARLSALRNSTNVSVHDFYGKGRRERERELNPYSFLHCFDLSSSSLSKAVRVLVPVAKVTGETAVNSNPVGIND